MHVIATAGHVDHGKSTLIRALTGTDPDRWQEEKDRGLTIDLGFAWMQLASGEVLSFVDVPGHERFLANTLAGLGPAPMVMMVVAADSGWQQQTTDHRDAINALGISDGVIALTRADLAPDAVPHVTAQIRTELAGTSLAEAPIIPVSATTGEGMDALRDALTTVVQAAPPADPDARLRLWIDRAFTISGAGTVVTGTLTAGSLTRDDRLTLIGADGSSAVHVRGLQNRGGSVERIEPSSRVAVNLRGVPADTIHRGDVLLTPGAWHVTEVIDVAAVTGNDFIDAPAELLVHIGTAVVNASVRPLGTNHARLLLEQSLPLEIGDRLVTRASGAHEVFAGVRVMDVDPPQLTRRGDGARRAEQLSAPDLVSTLAFEVKRRGAVKAADLSRFGVAVPQDLPATVVRAQQWLVDQEQLDSWSAQLRDHVQADAARNPLSVGVPTPAVVNALRLPDPILVGSVAKVSGLQVRDGVVIDPDRTTSLGAAEAGISAVEKRLRVEPFAAPEAEDLQALGLGTRELAAAVNQGRILRVAPGIVLLPTAPALAMRELAALPQPFTLSQARQALGTTRRVAVPLLEHLDQRGWTRRVDAGHREVVR